MKFYLKNMITLQKINYLRLKYGCVDRNITFLPPPGQPASPKPHAWRMLIGSCDHAGGRCASDRHKRTIGYSRIRDNATQSGRWEENDAGRTPDSENMKHGGYTNVAKMNKYFPPIYYLLFLFWGLDGLRVLNSNSTFKYGAINWENVHLELQKGRTIRNCMPVFMVPLILHIFPTFCLFWVTRWHHHFPIGDFSVFVIRFSFSYLFHYFFIKIIRIY